MMQQFRDIKYRAKLEDSFYFPSFTLPPPPSFCMDTFLCSLIAFSFSINGLYILFCVFFFNFMIWLRGHSNSMCPSHIFNYSWHTIVYHIYLNLGFPGGASGKKPACQGRRHKRHGFDPWVGKMPWSRKWQPTQYSCLKNPMDRGGWWATVHRVTKSWTRLKWLSLHATPRLYYCHPAYLTSMQSTSWEMLGWKKHKLEWRLLGEISITSDMRMTPPLWQKVKRNFKKPVEESERREWKSWLKA